MRTKSETSWDPRGRAIGNRVVDHDARQDPTASIAQVQRDDIGTPHGENGRHLSLDLDPMSPRQKAVAHHRHNKSHVEHDQRQRELSEAARQLLRMVIDYRLRQTS